MESNVECTRHNSGEPETSINHEEGPVSSNEEYNKGLLSLMRCPF